MKKVGFIGAFDKIDLVLYVAKMLTIANKKVLLVDTTIEQRARYIVPTINPTVSYITQFQNIDVAIGFKSLNEICEYLSMQKLDYDYVLVDIDSIEVFNNFEMKEAYKNYFVTSFDLYSIKRGLDVLETLNSPINLTKIIFSKEILNEENQYLDYLSMEYKVNWNEYRIYFPLDIGDKSAIIDNQRLEKIKFKNLSSQFRESLIYIAEELLEQVEINGFEKLLRTYEKGE